MNWDISPSSFLAKNPLSIPLAAPECGSSFDPNHTVLYPLAFNIYARVRILSGSSSLNARHMLWEYGYNEVKIEATAGIV